MRTLILALFGMCYLATHTAEGVGSEVIKRSVCVQLTTKPLHVKQVSRYIIDEGPVKAIVFITKRGIKICANPKHKWVKNVVKDLDRSAKKTMTQTITTRVQRATKAVTNTATNIATSTAITLINRLATRPLTS
ncbi:PREDICTED: cytokine SCM-1 beta [Condylura cristata]|uniref:cytokine SCM-1 beta n=1 Tax=Condylura cristata TaxID=143302 RepID=UPI0006428A27|nr:PREDICTED: cytokine SCM-1 beta [Condylura cristata]